MENAPTPVSEYRERMDSPESKHGASLQTPKAISKRELTTHYTLEFSQLPPKAWIYSQRPMSQKFCNDTSVVAPRRALNFLYSIGHHIPDGQDRPRSLRDHRPPSVQGTPRPPEMGNFRPKPTEWENRQGPERRAIQCASSLQSSGSKQHDVGLFETAMSLANPTGESLYRDQ